MIALLLASLSHVAAQGTLKSRRSDLPPQDILRFYSIDPQESNGPWRHLRKSARIVASDFEVTADEIDYNSDTDWAYARGHVHLEHFVTGEKLDAERAEYNLRSQTGKYYGISGTAPAKVVTSPSVLTTANPFYFQAKWAERIKDRYILHHGWLTDCTIERPWWRFQSPTFDVVPGERAIARNAIFRLHGAPIFYLPYFYRPLGKKTRQSGFLTPSFGNSSRYGTIYGLGYYWAINRSFDMTGLVQELSDRGPTVRYDFRGKPTQYTDFDFNFYSVFDDGLKQGVQRIKQGGETFELTARTQVLGFVGQLDLNYLSSYLFRQAFSYSIVSAVTNEIFSTGYLQRHFHHDDYSLNIVFQREQLFNSVTPLDTPADRDVIQKLPSVELYTRDQPVWKGSKIPVWWSLEASAGVLSRSEPVGPVDVRYGRRTNIDTDGFLRAGVEPQVSTELFWKGFSLTPSLSGGTLGYTKSYKENQTAYAGLVPIYNIAVGGDNFLRNNMNLAVDLRLPTMERVFTPPKWLHFGVKLKHVIEVDGKYEYITGIENFNHIIRIDSRDTLANTNQATVGLTNRLLRKDKSGKVRELLRWRVAHQRYFDPTFGGVVVAGQRNVVLESEEFSPFSFLDGRRNFSPVASTLTVSPYDFFSVEWRAEFDPKPSTYVDVNKNGIANIQKTHLIDQNLNANFRYHKLFASTGETAITTDPLQVPRTNQFSYGGGWGSTNGKGWNAAATIYNDLLLGKRIFSFFQASYNTDCCGFSLQVRQFNLGIRNENQYLFSFAVANIGNFGSLARQNRIF